MKKLLIVVILLSLLILVVSCAVPKEVAEDSTVDSVEEQELGTDLEDLDDLDDLDSLDIDFGDVENLE